MRVMSQPSFDPIREYRERRAQEAEAYAEALRQQTAEDMKARAYTSFRDAGGSDNEFKKAWPEIRTRLLIDQAARAVKGQQ